MSDYPPTPACIAKALCDLGNRYQNSTVYVPNEYAEEADAVWHALCDEGNAGYLRDGSSVLYRREVENAQHGLWIPLPNKEG